MESQPWASGESLDETLPSVTGQFKSKGVFE
jgi:hypothetical protein